MTTKVTVRPGVGPKSAVWTGVVVWQAGNFLPKYGKKIAFRPGVGRWTRLVVRQGRGVKPPPTGQKVTVRPPSQVVGGQAGRWTGGDYVYYFVLLPAIGISFLLCRGQQGTLDISIQSMLVEGKGPELQGKKGLTALVTEGPLTPTLQHLLLSKYQNHSLTH